VGPIHLKLTPRGRRDRTIRWAIGDALKCDCNSGQLKSNLLDSARPLQHNSPFSAEENSGPKQQSNHNGYTRHERVVACDSDASARDRNHVI